MTVLKMLLDQVSKQLERAVIMGWFNQALLGASKKKNALDF